MMDIKILGSGCAKCVRLAENAKAAADSLGLASTVEKVTDPDAIIDAGVLRTPGLMIDGKLVATGRLLSPEEIKPLLQSA